MILLLFIVAMLIFLAYKYATLAILFGADFLFIGLACYMFLKDKLGNDSAIITTAIILLLYGLILYFVNKKVSILSKIINYIASFIGAFFGAQLLIYMVTGILKLLGIFQNTYSELIVTHIKFVDDTINLIFAIVLSIFVYKKRMAILKDRLYFDDESYEIIDDEEQKFYQEYFRRKRLKEREYNYENEIDNGLQDKNDIDKDENYEDNYYISKHIYNTKLGELGEEFVYNIEKNSVAVFNKDYVDKVEHVSKKLYGDKLGYDISSIDINGNDLKIEVKTTTGDCDTPFFISENELRFLKEHKNDGAILYRVYNFNEETKTGEIKKITADEVLNNYKVDTKNYIIQKREEEINTNSENKIIPTVLLKYSEDVEAVYYDENIWMRKFMISKLFNINKKKSDSILNELLFDEVLNKDKNIKEFYIESNNGNCYNVEHFDLNSILKVGEKTNNEEIINLKKWIEEISHEYKIKNLDIEEN